MLERLTGSIRAEDYKPHTPILPGQTSRESFLQKPMETAGPDVIFTGDCLACLLVFVSH